MQEIIVGTILLSLLHAVIPSHWLPVLTVGQTLHWDVRKITRITCIIAIAHVTSTIVLGILVAKLGRAYAEEYGWFTPYIAPGLLILMGMLIIGIDFRRLNPWKKWNLERPRTQTGIIIGLVIVMFFSPCLEIEGYYLLAGSRAWWLTELISVIYAVVTVLGMMVWVRLMYRGLLKLNWETLQFNSSIITGMVLVATGLLIFII